MTDAEREALRQRNIQDRANGADDARKKFELEQAVKARDYAMREDAEKYDDEVVDAQTYVVPVPDGSTYRAHIRATKNGRTYRLIEAVDSDWTEILPPVPRTDARRTYNATRQADGDLAAINLRSAR